MTLQVGQLKKLVGMNTSRRNGQEDESSVFSELIDGLSLAYGGYRDNAGDTIFADVTFRNSWVRTMPRVLVCASCPYVPTYVLSWVRFSARVLCVFCVCHVFCTVMCVFIGWCFASCAFLSCVPVCILMCCTSVCMGTHTTCGTLVSVLSAYTVVYSCVCMDGHVTCLVYSCVFYIYYVLLCNLVYVRMDTYCASCTVIPSMLIRTVVSVMSLYTVLSSDLRIHVCVLRLILSQAFALVCGCSIYNAGLHDAF